MQESTAAAGLIARSAARILQKADKERSGVISTAQSHTHFLDSTRMARVMGRSTFDLSILKSEPTSVYLILPSDRLEAYARWLRLMIACTLLAIARALMSDPKLLLVDELSLGLAPIIVKNIYSTLKEINKSRNVTILVVEQNVRLALEVADRAYVIENGRITMEGAGKDLLASEAIKSAYLAVG